MSWITDQDAPHFNIPDEYVLADQKATPVDADRVLLEDSADGFEKKYAELGDLPGGGGGGVDVENSGTPVATATTLNFTTGLSATDAGGGQVDVAASGGGGGNAAYSETIGDNTNTSYTVTHNLGTTDLVVQLWDLTGTDPVEATGDASSIEAVSGNAIEVTFAAAPPVDSYRVVILADGGGGGGGVIAPDAVTGLAGWWDAQAITGLSDTDPVDQWDDESGNARHMTASGTVRPTYDAVSVLNGHPGVLFDGVNDVMSATYSDLSGSNKPWSAVVVYAADPTIGDSYVMALARSSTSTNPSHGLGWASGMYRSFRRNDSGTSSFHDQGLVPFDEVVLLSYVFDGRGFAMRVDGIAKGVNTHTSLTATLDRVVLGSQRPVGNSPGNYWDGPIGEVALYDQVLTGPEVVGLEAYMRAKWA